MSEEILAKLRALRAQHKYTQAYVAFCLGISQRAYSKIETGETQLRIEHLHKFSEIYQVEFLYFLDNEINQKEEPK